MIIITLILSLILSVLSLQLVPFEYIHQQLVLSPTRRTPSMTSILHGNS